MVHIDKDSTNEEYYKKTALGRFKKDYEKGCAVVETRYIPLYQAINCIMKAYDFGLEMGEEVSGNDECSKKMNEAVKAWEADKTVEVDADMGLDIAKAGIGATLPDLLDMVMHDLVNLEGPTDNLEIPLKKETLDSDTKCAEAIMNVLGMTHDSIRVRRFSEKENKNNDKKN